MLWYFVLFLFFYFHWLVCLNLCLYTFVTFGQICIIFPSPSHHIPFSSRRSPHKSWFQTILESRLLPHFSFFLFFSSKYHNAIRLSHPASTILQFPLVTAISPAVGGKHDLLALPQPNNDDDADDDDQNSGCMSS